MRKAFNEELLKAIELTGSPHSFRISSFLRL